MVTLAEFLQHVFLSALVMAVGLAAVTFTRFRFDTAHKSWRRWVAAYVGLLIIIALLSVGADVREVRCPRDPGNFCRLNDMTPAMATIAVVFMLGGLWRGRSMYTRR